MVYDAYKKYFDGKGVYMDKKRVIGIVAIAVSAASALGTAIYAGTKFLRKKKEKEQLDELAADEDIELIIDVFDADCATEDVVEVDLADVVLINEDFLAEEEQTELNEEESAAPEKKTD